MPIWIYKNKQGILLTKKTALPFYWSEGYRFSSDDLNQAYLNELIEATKQELESYNKDEDNKDLAGIEETANEATYIPELEEVKVKELEVIEVKKEIQAPTNKEKDNKMPCGTKKSNKPAPKPMKTAKPVKKGK